MSTVNTGSKPHFLILDGLRGVAALLVVIFHLMEGYFIDLGKIPMAHGFLAVDFFFLLSGFVVAYAYDERWQQMGVLEFFKIRIVRLHPLVILAVMVGAIAFYFDGFTNGMDKISVGWLLLVTLISLTLLPSPDLRGWGETHSLDGPLWSLFQEYIANVLYALGLRKASIQVLWILVGISALLLTYAAVSRGDIATGWGYPNFQYGLTRMLFPFLAGLLLFRTGKRFRWPFGFYLIAAALTALFFFPWIPGFNGWYESMAIIFAFPVLVAAGAGSHLGPKTEKLCKVLGDLSYPIYIIHYPFIYIYMSWIHTQKPTGTEVIQVAIALFFIFLFLAWAAMQWYDTPVRQWLTNKYLKPKTAA